MPHTRSIAQENRRFEKDLQDLSERFTEIARLNSDLQKEAEEKLLIKTKVRM